MGHKKNKKDQKRSLPINVNNKPWEFIEPTLNTY